MMLRSLAKVRFVGFLALWLSVVFLLTMRCAFAAPWVAVDWRGTEPHFPPGSLFWRTNEFRRCPVVYRTVLDVASKPTAAAGFRVQAKQYLYVFINGRQVAAATGKESATVRTDVEVTHLLKPGRNVLLVSAPADGFSLDGGIFYRDGATTRFGSEPPRWKAQKFPPLTVLEDEPCMKPEFEDAQWFAVRVADGEPLTVSDDELRAACERLALERLQRWDEEARWRLQMLASKGIAVVDWEAHGWAGAGRLPNWVGSLARQALSQSPPPGALHQVAEALTRYVRLNDEATNLQNHVVGLKALNAPAQDCQKAVSALLPLLRQMQQALLTHQFEQSLSLAAQSEAIVAAVRKGRVLNPLCSCLDNKFGWFDTTLLLENDIAQWGLRFGSQVSVFASPLSPAALVTVHGNELVIRGWDELKPLRVYNQPPHVGPVGLWAVIGGKVVNLQPAPDGTVYDRARHGRLSENWVLLVSDLSRGGHLPIQMVFLRSPTAIVFKSGPSGTSAVTVRFDQPEVQLFLLRPLKEWRGLLGQARAMTQTPLRESEVQRYVQPCRLWSRALLHYPVTFSEAFVRDPNDRWAIRVADVYNYWELQDEWGTQPLRLAPLPPLATYGLMRNYPGLHVLSPVETLGSRGVWGDEMAAVNQNYVVYRVPLDPLKRFGGFTAYCFGPTDIGEPGSATELDLIKRTGANTFRPQHNQSGERALKTARWAWERGLQNVFNTDEKWLPDVVEHYRTLAEQCKDFPPDAIAYDLLNEPETREPRAYNALIRKITNAIRAVDKTHLIYVEAMPPWGPGAQPFPQGAFETLEPTGDPLTVYSFHDYEYRLPPRWPNEQSDIRSLLSRWIPAFRFSIDHRAPIHLGEFGGFEQTQQSVYDNPCTITLLMDYFKVFDQFGWHFHYYSNRGIVRVRADGSVQESYVQAAYRRYFARGTFNVNR
ncbi:MAG: glycoside hydrolase family 5 protein [Abditibacteriales bacterium]|nr:glycoside hydrolase family 5 protein [Abditibacteriales bacterium]MDW8365738.1 cellulase family glycosylhydrolase [Abditibacteriales bacterium]